MPHVLDDTTPLAWARCEFDDLPELHALLTAIYYFDEPAERWTLEEIQDNYAMAGDAAAENIVVGREADSVVAFAWNNTVDMQPAIRVAGGVHPAYRHKGIGRRLIAWQMERAEEWFRAGHGDDEPLTLTAFADEKLAGKRRLYSRAGMAETRWMIDMHCDLREHSAVVCKALQHEVAGVRLVPFTPELSESARDCHNEAFASAWGSAPTDQVTWVESLSRTHSRPEWSWLAVDESGEVVGYSINAGYSNGPDDEPAEGWTERLGVRPAWRGRGLARVLLARSLESFWNAGLERAGLGVDSRRGGGVELYRSLGYEATDTIIQYERTIDPRAGEDAGHGKKKKGRH